MGVRNGQQLIDALSTEDLLFLYALSIHDLCWEAAGEACPKRADASQALRPVFSQVRVKSMFAEGCRLQALPRKLLML